MSRNQKNNRNIGFHISIKGNQYQEFYTKSGFLVAKGYKRIVIGNRGPYIEFTPEQIILENIFIPEEQKKRVSEDIWYYIEYRTKRDNVKIYLQKKTVAYADYRVGLYYISPSDLQTSYEKNKGQILRSFKSNQKTLEGFKNNDYQKSIDNFLGGGA